MEFNAEILKLIISQGIFAVLFVWLFYDTRKEAREREEKLMTQLDKTNQDHKLIIESINKLTGGI
ncbi:MAG: BhlA/UviB family holin-like peptide [Bacteroidales bacterium]|nr:BhlA/UviB family holin-like peptide [Bacteroidales bacterium]